MAELLTNEVIFSKQNRRRGFRFRKSDDSFIAERWGGDGWFTLKGFDPGYHPDDWLISLRDTLAAGVTAEEIQYILDQVGD